MEQIRIMFYCVDQLPVFYLPQILYPFSLYKPLVAGQTAKVNKEK